MKPSTCQGCAEILGDPTTLDYFFPGKNIFYRDPKSQFYQVKLVLLVLLLFYPVKTLKCSTLRGSKTFSFLLWKQQKLFTVAMVTSLA
jgi:hypothetical protein